MPDVEAPEISLAERGQSVAGTMPNESIDPTTNRVATENTPASGELQPPSGGLTSSSQPMEAATPAPLHTKIAEGIIHAFAGTDGTAGSALRSALAGGLAGLAAASKTNFKPGGAALGGLGVGATAAVNQADEQAQRKVENQQKQTAQQMEKTRQDYLNAETQARTVADQKTANRLDEEATQKRVTSGQAVAAAYGNHRTALGTGLTAEEILPEAKEGGKYDHTKITAIPTGTTTIFEGGQEHTVPTFTIYPRNAEDVTVTPEVASVLKEGGYNYPEGTKINGDLLDSLTTKSMAAQTSAALLKKSAADAKLSEDATNAALEKKSDLTAVNPYLGAHPDDPLTALGQLSQQKGKDGQPTPAAQSASRLLAGYDEKQLETHRHDVAEEKNKAEENRLKAAGDTEWKLNGPAGAPNAATGAAYLKTLPQPMAAALTEAAEGRGNPVMMQNRKGELTPMGEAMMKAYPDYDIGKAKEYPKLVHDFTDGPTSKSLTSYGTALNHARALFDNTGPQSYIPGTDEYKRYNQDITYVATEVAKALNPTGVATESAIQEQEKALRSITNRKAAIQNAGDILAGKMTEVKQRWQNGQVRPSYQPPMPSISPTAEANAEYLKNGGPKVGATKTFPNGAIGVWDGHGYVAQQKAAQ